MPDYNPWTALCHLTWYQPHHINLAFTLLTEQAGTIQEKLDARQEQDGIRWNDFGCGSFPMHIALDVATVIDPVLGAYRSRIHGIGIDSSEPMLSVGKKLMRKIREFDSNRTLGSIPLITRTNSRDDSFSVRQPRNRLTVLSVMHAFYRENIAQVKKEIARLIVSSDPELIFVTAHPSSERLLDCAFKDHLDEYDPEPIQTQRLRFGGELKPITALRQEWREIIETARGRRRAATGECRATRRGNAGGSSYRVHEWSASPNSIRNPANVVDLRAAEFDTAIRYLNSPVRWTGPPTVARVYFRKRTD